MNTSLQRGDVTPLAEKLAARFRKAGVPSADIEVIGPEAKNKNLVVRMRGKAAEQAGALPGASRCGGRAASRLVARTVRADRKGWLALRARHRRRQGPGDHAGGSGTGADTIEGDARSRHHPGAHVGRGECRRAGRSVAGAHSPAIWSTPTGSSTSTPAARAIDHGKLAWIELQGCREGLLDRDALGAQCRRTLVVAARRQRDLPAGQCAARASRRSTFRSTSPKSRARSSPRGRSSSRRRRPH